MQLADLPGQAETNTEQPGNGQVLVPDSQTSNTLLRAVRCRGERGFALLTAAGGHSAASPPVPAGSATTSKLGQFDHA